MRELLAVLADQLAFLFHPAGYRLSGSHAASAEGDAWIELEGDELSWRLVRDRSQVFLDCRSRHRAGGSWYSTDLLVRLLTGRRVDSAVLSLETARWVEENLAELESRFGKDRVAGTVEELEALKRRRARELFD